ncbi:DNA glycosylase [Xylaria arbuscula]|nr:DNA glycosylase [Xylaria arbuscula]
MSEDTSENDAVPSKEPSFNGRLQLKNFMFNAAVAPGTRRSPRLSSQTAISSSRSITPSEPASSTPQKQKQKRKSSKTTTHNDNLTPTTTTTTTPKDSEDDNSLSPQKKKTKRNRPSSSYAPPSAYAHLPPLTDVIAPNLLILFIGLNPGVQTARSGHAYAHPSNLFWKLLYSSGITPVPCRAEEDGTLPARFSLGNTNIVARPSRNGAELSKAEMDAGVAVLEDKCRRWRPEAVCVVGKSIWESIFRVWKGRNLTKADGFEYGWQDERRMGAPWEGARIFVATSTSGLAATVRPEEKERIWKILGDWCVQRRKEREEAKTEITDT